MHGAAGLGGVELAPSPAAADPRPAIVALADLLLTSPDPVTVAAVGPLTNLALLLQVFPEAAARIGRLVVMGGSAARGGNVTAAAEFNVWADPEAAQAVLGSALPTVLVGLDVTLPTVLDEVDIARFAAAGPIGAAAAAILQQYLDHARTAYGTTGVVVHDALALTEAIRPGFLGTVRRDVVVDTGLGAGRGQTLVDRRTVSTAPTAVEVAERVDSAAAVEFLVSGLAALDVARAGAEEKAPGAATGGEAPAGSGARQAGRARTYPVLAPAEAPRASTSRRISDASVAWRPARAVAGLPPGVDGSAGSTSSTSRP